MLRLDPWACLAGALLTLILPLPWLLAAVTAAVVHELGHLWAVQALGGRVRSLTIGPFGAVMDVTLEGRGHRLLAAAAGPAGSLLLLAALRLFPRLALCGLIQGLFNLLPLYPLDGGRMLRTVCPGQLPEWVLGAAVCLVILQWQAALGLLLAFRLIFEIYLAKKGKSGYNRGDNFYPR